MSDNNEFISRPKRFDELVEEGVRCASGVEPIVSSVELSPSTDPGWVYVIVRYEDVKVKVASDWIRVRKNK